MNVASSPWRAAISFTALLSRNASSAARSAGAARTLISNWPGPASGAHASTASPYSCSVARTAPAKSSCRDAATTPYTLGRSSTAFELRRPLCEHRLRRLAQRVELELDPDDRLDAQRPGALDDRAQDGARRQRDRRGRRDRRSRTAAAPCDRATGRCAPSRGRASRACPDSRRAGTSRRARQAAGRARPRRPGAPR